MNNQLEIFERSRSRLQAIAYRMLGTITDAEDIVQETFLKWQQVSFSEIKYPQAYLTQILTRLCIDRLRSIRVRREQYIGIWLPEPIVTSQNDCSQTSIELADSLAMAFLLLLEKLSPIERAVFLLREVFEYDYDEISKIVAKNPTNCRQIFKRAKKHLENNFSRFNPSLQQQKQLTKKFIQACTNGDLQELISLLAKDITIYSDGGGKVRALLKPMKGLLKVARFLIALHHSNLIPTYDLELVKVNGQIGIIYSLQGTIHNIVSLEIIDEQIHNIYFVRNPDKFKYSNSQFKIQNAKITLLLG
jgi:RNA polymerase sigma-70 factor, ECF subfamily